MQWVETVNSAYSVLLMHNSKIRPLHRQLVTVLSESLTSMEVDPNVQDEFIRARQEALYARRKIASLYKARKMFASFAARKSGTLSTTDSSSINSITSENFSMLPLVMLLCRYNNTDFPPLPGPVMSIMPDSNRQLPLRQPRIPQHPESTRGRKEVLCHGPRVDSEGG
eukprot:sb/3472332/